MDGNEIIYELSENQKGMYFDCMVEPIPHYNISVAIKIKENLDPVLFEKAINLIIKRHSALRTCFKIKDDLPVQIILPEVKFNLHVIDISNLSRTKKSKVIKKISLKNALDIFDLQKAPLLRAKLLKIDKDEFYFYLCVHHIICDGWSLEILKKELLEIYLKLKEGEKVEVKPLKEKFIDFIIRENKKLKSGKYNNLKNYWSKKLSSAMPLNFLTDYPKTLKFKGHGKEFTFTIEKDLYKKLKDISINQGTTLFMFLFAVFKVLLHKYTDSQDITVTSPFTNRPGFNFEKVIGYFVNLLPIRDFINPEMKFTDFLKNIKKTIIEAYKNVQYPNNLIFRELNKKEGFDNSLLDISFVFDVYDEESEALSKNMKIYELPQEVINFPGSFMMLFQDQQTFIIGKIQYNSKLYKESTIKRISKHFIHLLEQILSQPEIKISKLEIITEKEKKIILNDFNNVSMKFPKDKTIHELFEEKVKKNPDKIAIIYNDKFLTYKELNEKANQLARFLKRKGIKADTAVGIMIKRNLEMVVGILGILKAGGAYVPIDPDYPVDRIKYILKDSKISILLTKNIDKKFKWDGEIINIDLENKELFDGNTENIGKVNDSSNLAYIIYTSGSTGKAKGVMIEHKGVVNILTGLENLYPLLETDTYLLKTTYTFDVSVTELFGWFFGCGKLAILENEYEKDPEKILETIEKYEITHINFVPSMFRPFLDLLENPENISRLKKLKYIFVAGEAITPDVVNKYYNLNIPCEFVNIYGPTEATIYGLYYPLKNFKEGTNIPIGKPVPNFKCYIVNKYNQLQPIGVAGELCLSGVGLARGYVNQEILTNKKFVSNPFVDDEIKSFYHRMYHTGDLARWLPDGNVEYLGRIDFQVKIRGFRIELGEIENTLLKNPKIKEAVVIAKEDKNNNKYLCAYYSSDEEITDSELRDYLSNILPSYMIPSYFIQLKEFPHTDSGKINRKKLSLPKEFTRRVRNSYIAPKTLIEKTIAKIWKEVLNIDKVGINDNFFELGGHSLALIQISNKLKSVFNIDVPIIKLFQYPTVKSLVDYIQSRKKEDFKINKIYLNKKKYNKKNNIDIAVIGMAARFPGAKNIHNFWENLKNGIESIRHFTEEELIKAGIPEEELKHPNYVKAKGVLDDIEYFDHAVFNYSPKEVEVMDPQFRMLHQCAYEALEDAGYDPDRYKGLIGFFAGCSDNFNWITRLLLINSNMGDQYQAFTLTANNFLSTRISYKLNLKGPSFTVQSGCSTSLVSVHLACQSLIHKECDIALAGGVTIELPKITGYHYYEGMMFSPDGHCRPFDEMAKGTVFSDGVGLVVLKRLEDAIRDGDYIYAIVKASAINNDGNSKVAYTAPSIEGQTAAIKAAYQRAGLSPETISYIESHGTGTSLGDPIEIESLKIAFNTNKKQFCWIGSVKGNIGHMDIAAGIGGFIKTVLCLKNKEIPPTINFEKTNSKIDFINSPFVVNTKLIKWENPEGKPLRAGINAFGVGGTNVHVILEEAPKLKPSSDGRDWKLLVLSANSKSALERGTKNLIDYLRKNKNINLSDVAYTLHLGRKAYKYRKTVVCSTINEAIYKLSSPELKIYNVKENIPSIIFVFNSQNSHSIRIPEKLYKNEKYFRQIVDQCFEFLDDKVKKKIKNIYLIKNKNYKKEEQFLIMNIISFIVQYATARLLIKWGISPFALIGEGIGEYVMACIAGIASEKDILRLISFSIKTHNNNNIILEELKNINLNKSRIPCYSLRYNKWIKGEEILHTEFWNLNLKNNDDLKVELNKLFDENNLCIIQFGIEKILKNFVFHENKYILLNILYQNGKKISDYQYLLETLGKLWGAGINIDWESFYSHEKRHRIPLPTYSFDKHYFPIDTISLEKLLSSKKDDLNNFMTNKPIIYNREKSEDYVAPSNEIEEAIVKAFQNVLGINNISIHEDFFELGGDSLKAVSLISEIHKSLNVKVDLSELFKRSTPAELAKFIDSFSQKDIYLSIEPVEKKSYYPLSSAQKRMYALYQLDEKSLAYNLPSATIVEGEIDFNRFEQAFKKLVKRHEALRTSFKIFNGEPVQIIHDDVKLDIKYKEVIINDDREIEKLALDFIKPYDLSKAPLFRVEIVKIGKNRHVLLFDVHHIIADGTSAEILSRDGCQLYFEDLPDLKIQYKDFAVWQNNLLKSDKIQKQKKYWLERFKGEIPILDMPTDYPRPPIKTFDGDKFYFEINEELTEKIKKLASQNGATLYMTLMTIYYILLYKYTGQNDIIIGSPNAGRKHPDLENVVGMFVNTLAMRNFPEGSKTFKEFLLEVKENSLKAFENQDYQFDELIEQLNLERDISRNPLFETEFDLQNMEFYEMNVENLKFIPYRIKTKTSQFDIALECEEHNNKINALFEYCTNIFKLETIKRMAKHYLKIIKIVTTTPDIKLKDINVNDEEDVKLLLYDFNNTKRDYKAEKTIAQLFEEQVEKNPDNIAVICKDENLTYRELNNKVNSLANLLRNKGVGRETFVGLLTKRSLEMIIGMLAIIKAGGAYIPLDPDYPIERINYMINDSDIKLILTQKGIDFNYDFEGEIIYLDDPLIYKYNIKNPSLINKSTDLIYMIYTSGSTGKPKGVMIPHKAVHNFINGITDRIDFNENRKILSLTTFSFDIFVLESLLPLTKGLTIIIANEEEQNDPEKLNELICKYSIDLLQTTPSRMKTIVEDDECNKALEKLKCIMIGGENFPLSLLKQLRNKTNAKIYNMYGPTETTVWSTIQDLTDRNRITIGTPIANTQIYILDENNNLTPIGVFGELCIAGDGLAKGYYKRPELTSEKFVPNPFKPGSLMYKTGDLARWLPNGELEIKGRIDSQVKVRGYRVELEEIEHYLLKHPAVKEACVVKRTDNKNNDYLCAYWVLKEGYKIPSISELRNFIAEKLPYYMIPSHLVKIDRLPLTPNGKINRRALPEPENLKSHNKSTFVSPKSDIEKQIADIWKEVLGIDKISIYDNFFEIGGHSMALIQATTRLRKLINKDIPIVTMFQYPTIESLTRFLKSHEIEFQKQFKVKPKRISTTGDIAVIGLAGRFPGASSIEEYWDNLINGKETISHFTIEELLESGIDEKLLQNPNYIRAKGYLEDIEYFDAAFFDYSPKEADIMDPQFRLLHECTWQALENAGYNPDIYNKPIGLFVGSASNLIWLTRFIGLDNNPIQSFDAGTLNEKDFVATRISYKLNLKGPSFTVQTACSTSLVTIHLACQSLLKGECNIALAGGVSISLPRKEGYLYQEGMIFSKDGHCRPFDASASGTVFGNGVGIVALKRLEEAIQDGDFIYAVIKGSAINNDGIRKVGFTAPSIEGQAEVIMEACNIANISPETISYIETHGTGTILGDPIEIEALKLAFNTKKRNYCAIGSVKANIGHLDTAAGVASFIKTVLSLKNKKIPPSINFSKPNPKIDFENSPFFVNTELREWKTSEYPLRAGVSSFGIGGTNCHIVLEEAPERRNK